MTFTVLGSPANLNFAQSQSKAVGVAGALRQAIKDNAVSIVGFIQMVGAGILLFDSNPVLKAIGGAGLVTRGVMTAYGNKNHQQNLAKEKGGELPDLGSGITDNIRKAMMPSAYPLEFSAAASIVASMAGIALGASLELDDDAVSSGKTLVAVGVASLAAYTYLLFGAEKSAAEAKKEEADSLLFSESSSQAQGWLGSVAQRLKDNPVLTSSVIAGAVAAAQTLGNFLEGNQILAATSATFFISNIVQALFVRKNESSIDSAKEDIQQIDDDQKLATPSTSVNIDVLTQTQPKERVAR